MIGTNSFPDNINKKAKVTPIFKKDDPFSMEDYRPVSKLSSTHNLNKSQ